MNSSDPNDEPESRLRDAVRSLPLPEAPDLESRVRRRLRHRALQRQLLVSASAAVLLFSLLLWQPWRNAPAPMVQHPQPSPPVAQAPSREIPADELAVLFAPPPVDPLTILDGRNRGVVAVLNRLEDMK